MHVCDVKVAKIKERLVRSGKRWFNTLPILIPYLGPLEGAFDWVVGV